MIYPVDSAIQRLNNRDQGPVGQNVDSAIQQINLYPVDSAIGFPNTYPWDSDLSGREHYPSFKQPGPGPSCSNKQC